MTLRGSLSNMSTGKFGVVFTKNPSPSVVQYPKLSVWQAGFCYHFTGD